MEEKKRNESLSQNPREDPHTKHSWRRALGGGGGGEIGAERWPESFLKKKKRWKKRRAVEKKAGQPTGVSPSKCG